MRCSSSEYQPCWAGEGNYLPSLEPLGQVMPVCFQPMETASTRTCCQHTENSFHLMCCCGCSLKFICREGSKEKAFRQIALWISALHLLLFLVCGTRVVCREWNAAERRVKGEKIWKRQGRRILVWTSTTPKMHVLIGHCLIKENLNMQTNSQISPPPPNPPAK